MNKRWSKDIKIKIVKELIDGRSYSSIAKEYGIKSTGMMANWKAQYLNGTLSDNQPGRKRIDEVEEYELLKKCYAQLKKIRTK